MAEIATLGDAGASNDDSSYAGSDGSSVLSPDYFREKLREFQTTLQALDASYQAGNAVYFSNPTDEVYALLIDYENKIGEIRATAEALNMGASAANALGVRMPVLSLPSSLGALPAFVVPAVTLAAVAAVASYVSYARGFTAAMAQAIKVVDETVTDPDQKVAVTAKLREAQAAQSLANFGGLSSIATPLKWAALLGLGFIAWQVMQRSLRD